MTTDHLAHYRLGAELAKYVRSQTGQVVPPVTALQAVVADIAATTPNLAIPLRDVVSRQSFQSLIPLAGSGGGDLQLKALVDDIRQLYHPDVVQALAEVLNGFLERRGEATPRVEEYANNTALIPKALKEGAQASKRDCSFKDVGSDDVKRLQHDEARAIEALQNTFMHRRQYAEREIDSLLKKSEQGGGKRCAKKRREKEPRVTRLDSRLCLEVLAAGSIIALVFVGGARPADKPAAAAMALGSTALLTLGSNAVRKGR